MLILWRYKDEPEDPCPQGDQNPVGKIERGKSLSMIVIKTKILTNTLTLDLPKKDKVLSLL